MSWGGLGETSLGDVFALGGEGKKEGFLPGRGIVGASVAGLPLKAT
jgi:hypothetical protein